MGKRILLALLVPVTFLMAGTKAYVSAIDYGLRFHANTYATKTESSLLLCGGREIRTGKKDFTLEFDLRNRETMQFGSVLRIVDGAGVPIDLIYYVNEKSMFILAATFRDEVIDFAASTAGIGDWHHVKVVVSPAEGSIMVTYADEVHAFSDASIRGMDRFRAVFGSVGRFGAGPKEVAGVDIRDIRLSKAATPLYHWPLSAHGDGFCRDSLRGSKAVEAGCEWLSDRYIRWKEELSLTRPAIRGVDIGEGRIWIVGDGTVETFDCVTGTLSTAEVSGSERLCEVSHHIKYIPGGLISYNLDGKKFSVYDPRQRRWSGSAVYEGDYCHYNNTSCVDSAARRIVSFGGYGLYRFSDEFSTLSYESGDFRSTHLPGLSYRLGPSSAFVHGKCYVWGGYGSFNGHQGFAVRYYNDLHAIDPETFRTEELWSEPPSDEGSLPCENMVWNEAERCFYLVRANTGFVLERLSLDTPGLRGISLPYLGEIPEEAIYPGYLFLCPQSGKLYCCIETAGDDPGQKLTLLSMLWPPQSADSLLETEPERRRWPPFAAGALLLLAGAAGFLFARRKKPGPGVSSPDALSEGKTRMYDFSSSCICLLGGFKVMDRQGRDITASFTPTLKSIFVLLLLSSPKGGIAAARFDRIIWPYKPEDSTSNNRNVYLSRLRPLLEQVGDIHVTTKNRILRIENPGNVLCDYLEIMRLFGMGRDNDSLRRLTELLQPGALLPNMEQSWTEPYKRELSSKTVEILGYQLRREDLPKETILGIADLILKYDFLNENAFRTKCRILVLQGNPGLAKDVYDNFCSEYQDLMGVEYPLSFNKIVE